MKTLAALPLAIGVVSVAFADSVLDIINQRQQLDASIWENERLAQEYETAFIQLWDEMRKQDDQADALVDFPLNTLFLPALAPQRALPHGIQHLVHKGSFQPALNRESFQKFIRNYQSMGYRIEQSEWHHASFEPRPGDSPQSTFTFALHVRNVQDPERIIFRGKLQVDWQGRPNHGTYLPDEIRILNMDMLQRENEPSFEESLWLESKGNTTPYSLVLVEDLNQDGLPDIAFPRYNKLYYNKGNFQFEESTLAQFMIRGLPTAAFFADLNLDGNIEYVVSTFDAPFIFAYTYNPETNAFDGKPFGIWKSDTPLRIQLLAAGDLTGDGRPEIYVGQSTPAYEDGKVPAPYFDANDGRPAFLLQNVDGLRYQDITELSSIADKRGRRAYTASFQDLNGDNGIDLMVTSDFSGIDVHENRYGALKEKTDSYLDDRSLFGMSHAFADFDRDGALDILAVGMSSTTARRLEQMGLGRDEFPKHQEMRMRIAKGNRLYYGNRKGTFAERSSSNDVARSGWSWGSSTLDFNNDSYPDIFISNGYLSKSTARDYCSNFWTHDIYSDTAFSQEQLNTFYDQFGPKALVGGNQMGWNPFEKDHLFLNLEGEEFINISYLLGVANGGDGRAVIGEDFDRDGKTDLLLVEQDSLKSSERVYVYKNQLQETGNWIALDLRQAAGQPLIGTRVVLKTDSYQTERLYTHGETYSGQHSSTLHFGLGDAQSVTQVEIHWPNQKTATLENPSPNQYHVVAQ
ncbi:MAG: CRTAC1 family protein [Verrucomicrobiota bacterium]